MAKTAGEMTVKEAGRMGGKAVKDKYGVEFFSRGPIGKGAEFHGHGDPDRRVDHAASIANVSASTKVPRPISSGDAYSSGRWLYPLRHGINNIATGAIREMNSES